MTRYAAQTDVPSDRSRTEIERVLTRYGATSFAYGWDAGAAQIGFAMRDRHVKFVLPMPDRAARRFTHTPERGNLRSREAADREYDQAVRQAWRALLLVIKAKLEAVDAGITTIEAEFLAHIVLPDGRQVMDALAPQLEDAYRTGRMPPLLSPPRNGGGSP